MKKKKEMPKKEATHKANKSKNKSKIGVVMNEFKEGKLHSGSKKGPKVTSKDQAIAIGISEAKKAGQKVKKKK